MPKPKRRKDSPPLVVVDPLRRTEEQLRDAQRQLLDLLGLRPPENFAEINNHYRIVCEVEILVRNFEPLLANPPPTNAYFRECLAPIATDAEKLRSTLHASVVRDYLEAHLEQSGIRLRETEQNLAKLCDALRQEVARLDQYESRGRPVGASFESLVHTLAELFEREYRGTASKQRVRRGFVEVSPFERARNKFIKHVLRSAGVYCPTDIGRYFLPNTKKSGSTDPKPSRRKKK